MSAALAAAAGSTRKAGRASSRCRQGAAAAAETARPVRGETKARSSRVRSTHSRKIEAKAEVGQQRQLPADIGRGPSGIVLDRVQQRSAGPRIAPAAARVPAAPCRAPHRPRPPPPAAPHPPAPPVPSTWSIRRRRCPSCSASRPRQRQTTRLPGCRTPRARRPAPPRTSPVWRPCVRVSTDTHHRGFAQRPRRQHHSFVVPFHGYAGSGIGATAGRTACRSVTCSNIGTNKCA